MVGRTTHRRKIVGDRVILGEGAQGLGHRRIEIRVLETGIGQSGNSILSQNCRGCGVCQVTCQIVRQHIAKPHVRAGNLVIHIRKDAGHQARAFGTHVVGFEHDLLGKLILKSCAPVLRVRLRQGLPGEEVDTGTIGRGGIARRQCTAEGWNTNLSRGGQRSALEPSPVSDRIKREAGRRSASGQIHRAVVAEDVLTAEIVQDRRTEGNPITPAKNEILSNRIGKAKARRDLFVVGVLEGTAMNAGGAAAQENERARKVVGSRVRRVGIEPGQAIERFLLGQRDFPANADVEGELRGSL